MRLKTCYPLISQTSIDYGTQLSLIISDAAVQYIAGIIDEDGLCAVWLIGLHRAAMP